jgi:putative acetyltransferase
MSIRKYSQRDYNQLLEIYSASKLDELKYENTIFELIPLEKDEIRLTQIIESEIYTYRTKYAVGFCAYSGAEIRALFVHPDFRGKGIGVSLLEFMLSNIIGAATLYVAASNYPAIKLYQKYGFKIISEFKTTYNKQNVVANKMEQIAVDG